MYCFKNDVASPTIFCNPKIVILKIIEYEKGSILENGGHMVSRELFFKKTIGLGVGDFISFPSSVSGHSGPLFPQSVK